MRAVVRHGILAVSVVAIGATMSAQRAEAPQPTLAPTPHPALPGDPAGLWFVPAKAATRSEQALEDFARGVKLEAAGDHASALALVSAPALQSTALARYASYFTGLAQLGLNRPVEARATFAKLRATPLNGYIAEAAALREAEASEAAGDPGRAASIYLDLAERKGSVRHEWLGRAAGSADAAGDRARAIELWREIYFDYPLSSFADDADRQLTAWKAFPVFQENGPRYAMEMRRATRLFAAKRYAPARASFALLHSYAKEDEVDLVGLRIAECDFHLGRAQAARDGVRPYIESGPREFEARYYFLSATRQVGQHDEYVALARRLVKEGPDSPWAEDTLDGLGTFLILQNEDAEAADAFRELYAKFPKGRLAERAAWKAGWWAYRTGDYREAVRLFESAAAGFPRSDYRPPFLYWAGRSHDALGEAAMATERYTLVATDYLNTYYGRLAAAKLDERKAPRPATAIAPPATDGKDPGSIPSAPVIRALLGLQLYEQALDELGYAERTWGASPAIQATVAWACNQTGSLRRGINTMKRAYPQYMAAGGERLSLEALMVIFPMRYWDLIRSNAAAHNLDPFVVAALIGQESTFDAQIKSSANAYGLMQILPMTGRRVARSLGIRRFTTAMLTDPTVNVRLGTAYLAALIKQFGDVHLALASYNAGEHRVVRWTSERPGLPREEFIDDIPFPETQNYVKRVLGTADDYRRIYSDGEAVAAAATMRPVLKSAPAARTPPRATVRKPRASSTKPSRATQTTRSTTAKK